jgi:hypothetical protein
LTFKITKPPGLIWLSPSKYLVVSHIPYLPSSNHRGFSEKTITVVLLGLNELILKIERVIPDEIN